MKTRFSTLVVAVLLVFQFSCKKDSAVSNSNNNNNNNNNNSNDSVYLAKWFSIDTTLTAPLDTICRMSFSYDTNHRPSTIVYTDFKPNGDSNFYWHVNYEYNGNDTFAYRTIEYTREFQTTISVSEDTFYYHFNNGICDWDSLAGDGHYQRNNYSFFTGYIHRDLYQTTFSPAYTTTGNSRIYQTKVNGNLTYQLDTLVRHVSPGSATNYTYLREEYSISYFNNPDPFYKITAPVKSEFYDNGDWLPFGKYVTRNLISDVSYSQSYWQTGGGVSTNVGSSHCTYTFRADGYPVEGRLVYGMPLQTYKTIYIYQ